MRSVPATLTTAPSGARLPRRIARPPCALSGSSSGRTTSWPGGLGRGVGLLADRAAGDRDLRRGAGARPRRGGLRISGTPPARVEVGGDEAAAGLQVGEQRRLLGDPLEVVDLELDARPRGRPRAGGGRRWSSRRTRRRMAIAFSSDSRVMIWLGRRSSASTFITSSPICSATVVLAPRPRPGPSPSRPAEIPSASKAQAIVLAVNWPPQAPAPGLATSSSVGAAPRRSSCPAAWAPIASKTSRIVTSLSVLAAGSDRAAVEHHRGDVEAGERHHAAGDRLVAGARARPRRRTGSRATVSSIESAITSRLTSEVFIPCGAHRDPVGDRDRVELHRRAAGGADALLDRARRAPRRWKLQGIASIQVLAIPIVGCLRASSSKPMPFM